MVTSSVNQADDALAGVKSFLEHVRRSSSPDAPCTVSIDVEHAYGVGEQRGADDPELWLIEYALDFANGVTLPTKARRTGGGARLDQNEVTDRRAWWREVLAALVADPAQARKRFGAAVAEAFDKKVWSFPSVDTSGGGFKVRDHYIIPDVDSFDAYVASMLLDEGFREKVCQCKLTYCKRYFLMQKPRTGRPRTDYCTQEHMEVAHAQGAVQRVRKHRAKAARKSK